MLSIAFISLIYCDIFFFYINKKYNFNSIRIIFKNVNFPRILLILIFEKCSEECIMRNARLFRTQHTSYTTYWSEIIEKLSDVRYIHNLWRWSKLPRAGIRACFYPFLPLLATIYRTFVSSVVSRVWSSLESQVGVLLSSDIASNSQEKNHRMLFFERK